MRLLLCHTFAILRLFLYWYRGLVLVLILAPLLIQVYLVFYTDFDLWLDDPLALPHPYGWVRVEMYFLTVAWLVLYALTDKRSLDKAALLRTPHPVLPLTPRGRALSEVLGMTIVCLGGGLAITGLQCHIWDIPFWAACRGFTVAWILWLPLITAAVLQVNAGRADTAMLMAAGLGAAIWGAGRLGLLDTHLGTLTVSAALMVAVLLLGNRPRVRILPRGVVARLREITVTGWSRPEGEILYRAGGDPLVQLRRDTWRETTLLLRIGSQIVMAMGLVALAFSWLGMPWGLGGGLLLGGVALTVFLLNIRRYRGGIPGDTVPSSHGKTLMGGYFRAWAILPVPTYALARALLLQATIVVGFLLGVLLGLAGISFLLDNAAAALGIVGFVVGITIGILVSCGVCIAFATGNLKERAIAAIGLVCALVVVLDLMWAVGVSWSWEKAALCLVLAIPATLLGGILPMARVLRSPASEVSDERF